MVDICHWVSNSRHTCLGITELVWMGWPPELLTSSIGTPSLMEGVPTFRVDFFPSVTLSHVNQLCKYPINPFGVEGHESEASPKTVNMRRLSKSYSSCILESNYVTVTPSSLLLFSLGSPTYPSHGILLPHRSKAIGLIYYELKCPKWGGNIILIPSEVLSQVFIVATESINTEIYHFPILRINGKPEWRVV